MNHTNLKALLAALAKVNPKEFDISSEFNMESNMHPTITDFTNRACGTTACAAGFGALDPKCNSLGLVPQLADRKYLVGVTYKGFTDSEAMAKFLDIDDELASHLFAYWGLSTVLYNKHVDNITLYDVIYQLEYLRLTGTLHWGHNATSKFTSKDAELYVSEHLSVG